MHLNIDITLPGGTTRTDSENKTELLYTLSKVREKLTAGWESGPIYTVHGEFVGTFKVEQ